MKIHFWYTGCLAWPLDYKHLASMQCRWTTSFSSVYCSKFMLSIMYLPISLLHLVMLSTSHPCKWTTSFSYIHCSVNVKRYNTYAETHPEENEVVHNCKYTKFECDHFIIIHCLWQDRSWSFYMHFITWPSCNNTAKYVTFRF